MAYTSFDQAWAAYKGVYALEQGYRDSVDFWLTQISVASTIAALRSATYSCCLSLRAWNAWNAYITTGDYTTSAFYMALYFAGQGGAAFDMNTLLSTMLSADFDQLRVFVGILDAYRSALWDQPFNAEFYAALARGFRP